MSPELDDLESLVTEDMRGIYSDMVINHAMNPRNVGSIKDDDGFGMIGGSCGDTMEIWIKVKGDKIQNATFWTDGCGATIATGSVVTEMARGKSVAEAQRITKYDVVDILEWLPEDHIHCAALAVNTLREAIKEYLVYKNEPWKKAYRRR